MNHEWETLISLLEGNEAYPDFVAECIYAYLEAYGEGSADQLLSNGLLEFIRELNAR